MKPLRAMPSTLTSVLHGSLAVARSIASKEINRLNKQENHIVSSDSVLKLLGMDKSIKCAYSFIGRPWIKCKSSQVSKQTLNRQTNEQINWIDLLLAIQKSKLNGSPSKCPLKRFCGKRLPFNNAPRFSNLKSEWIRYYCKFKCYCIFIFSCSKYGFLKILEIFNFNFTSYWEKLDERGKHHSCSELRPLTMAAGGKMLLERLSWCPLAAKIMS